MGIISITSCQGLPMRDLIPLSTDKWLTNNWPMTDQYCAISYQFFWLESLFLVILDCESNLGLHIYWFYTIFPSISISNHVFILFFRCCCNKYVTGVRSAKSIGVLKKKNLSKVPKKRKRKTFSMKIKRSNLLFNFFFRLTIPPGDL